MKSSRRIGPAMLAGLALAGSVLAAGCTTAPPAVAGSETSRFDAALKAQRDRLSALERPERLPAAAVLGITNTTRRGDLMLRNEADAMLEGELSRSGWFQMLPKPWAEGRGPGTFTPEDVLGDDPDARQTRARLRSALRADYYIEGAVVHLGSMERIYSNWRRSDKAVTAEAGVELFARDAETGAVLASARGEGRWEDRYSQQGGLGLIDPQFEQRALRLAVGDAVTGLIESLARQRAAAGIAPAGYTVAEVVRQFAEELGARVEAGATPRVLVFDIRTWDNQALSDYSEFIRKNLEEAFTGHALFDVAPNDNLRDMEIANRLDAYHAGVAADPRGTFTFHGGDVLVRGNLFEGRRETALFLEAIRQDGVYLHQRQLPVLLPR